MFLPRPFQHIANTSKSCFFDRVNFGSITRFQITIYDEEFVSLGFGYSLARLNPFEGKCNYVIAGVDLLGVQPGKTSCFLHQPIEAKHQDPLGYLYIIFIPPMEFTERDKFYSECKAFIKDHWKAYGRKHAEMIDWRYIMSKSRGNSMTIGQGDVFGDVKT